MRESDTYQAILEEDLERGRLEEAMKALFLVGIPRLGQVDVELRRRIQAEASLAQLEQ